MREVFMVAAARTPIGTAGHGLRDVTADRLAAPVVARLVGAGGLDEVILGNCFGPGGNVARVAALEAGLPDDLPALTIDRQCASGLAAISLGCNAIRSEAADTIIGGGVESASTAPTRLWPAAPGQAAQAYQRAPFAPAGRDLDMGAANDLLAHEAGISRARQDAYAARSHARALAAAAAGAFDAELVPVAGLDHDERPRPITEATLARLRPAFRVDGTVTAGNSCPISDGAAAVRLSATAPEPGRAVRVLAMATAAAAPERPGRGLVPCTQKVLQDSGIGLQEVDVIEFNEAFAGQVLACCDELGIDEDRVCREGGALALGHPWGASGAVLAVRLMAQLGPGQIGLAAIAAGGGQGVAMVVARC